MRNNTVKALIALAMAAAMVGSAIPVAAYADPNSIQLPDGTIIWVDDDGNVVAEGDARWLTLADGTEALVDTDGTVAWYRGGYLETLPDGTAAWVDEYEGRVVAHGAQRLELADGTVAWVDEGGAIVGSPSVADAVVTLGRESYAYDGSAKDPGVASVTFHGQELVEGVDYRVERPAGRTNAGTYTYVVRGVNNFVGTARASFTITPAQVKPRVKLSKKRFVWDGRTKVPGITVLANGKVLVEGTDYYTNIPGNKKSAGVYLYGVKLKGNYEGWEIMSYEIVPKATTAKKPTAGTRSLTARWRRQLRQVTGYEVQCGTRRSFRGAKTVRVKGAKRTSKRIGKLESGKRYYVRVRTYKVADGQTVRSAWSKPQSVRVL
ncbi:MAG: fibronectin type III domain-containing protein [Atopobiaceae bacterium]|nr:fibronectin type III domain-containing protein [Atopobiaceae bacterium]